MVLILDKDTQSLPWESLPAFRSAPLSRSPSLFHLASLHALHVERLRDSIEASKIVYVLNPENDVAQTQAANPGVAATPVSSNSSRAKARLSWVKALTST